MGDASQDSSNPSRCYGASGTPVKLATAFLSEFRGFSAKMTQDLKDFMFSDNNEIVRPKPSPVMTMPA